MKRLLLGFAALAAVACARIHPGEAIPEGNGALVVIYKAEVGGDGPAARGAKLALWAEGPDRLHAELLGPMGGVTFTLDAGAGRVCVVDHAAGVAYTGEDDPGALEALVGVRVTVADAVAALLQGTSPPGLSVARGGGPEGSLPGTLRIAEGERFVALTRTRVDRGRIDARVVGTGLPPAGFPIQPIENFAGARASRR